MRATEPVDEPFFREWSQRSDRERRSLDRARAFAERMGLDLRSLHPLVVVGSKGKGTTATYAAATLAATGASVGLITSPGYRSHHERIRYEGVSISADHFERLAGRVSAAIAALPPPAGGSGYLSPTGAFTIAGLAWLVEQGCDALVVEAGMGGASDESSLTQPSVVAVTEIFEEHLSIIGDDLGEIAADKAGMICDATHAVLSLPPAPVVRQAIETAATRSGAELTFLSRDRSAVPFPLPAAVAAVAALPTDLLRRNARLGIEAAARYLGVLGRQLPSGPALEGRLREVRLPGRLSVHELDGQTWVVDSAINPTGVRAALDWCRRTVGEPSIVLLAIPDTKDLAACLDALADAPARLVRSDSSHLTFSGLDGADAPPRFRDVDPAGLGPVVVAVGTISFVGEVLDLLDVDMTSLF